MGFSSSVGGMHSFSRLILHSSNFWNKFNYNEYWKEKVNCSLEREITTVTLENLSSLKATYNRDNCRLIHDHYSSS